LASTANELLAHFAILSSAKKTETSFHAQKANLKKEKENEEMVDKFADKTTIGNNFHDNLLFKFLTI
jgi:hypothetical protein